MIDGEPLFCKTGEGELDGGAVSTVQLSMRFLSAELSGVLITGVPGVAGQLVIL